MKTLTLTLLTLLFLPLGTQARTDTEVTHRKEYSKELARVFEASQFGELSIHNRHGRVDVKTWDKPEIRVEVTIAVQAKDERQAAAIFDRIEIHFENGDDFVKATTSIRNKKSGNWSDWGSWGGSQKEEYEINYEVNMPHTNRLNLHNRYGDTYVAETKGPVRADIAYGSIRLQGVGGALNLRLAYGDGTVITAGTMNADVSYSKLSLRHSRDVDLQTKYSQISIEEVGVMRVITKYDDFHIHQVSHLRAEGKYGKFSIDYVEQLIADGKYTDYFIGTLGKAADVILAYGGLSIETLEARFGNIRLDGSYANFKITTTPGSSYLIEASAAYGSIQAPDSAHVSYESDSGHSYHLEAQVGEAPIESSIKVKMNYGDVQIR